MSLERKLARARARRRSMGVSENPLTRGRERHARMQARRKRGRR